MQTLYGGLYLLLALSVGAILYGALARSKTTAVVGAALMVILLLLIAVLYLSIGAVLIGGEASLSL